MAQIQRHLVSLEMLVDDLSLLSANECGTNAHLKLIRDYRQVLASLLESVQHETESSFKKWLIPTLFAQVFENKRMVGIHLRLVDYVLTYWQTMQKVNDIRETNFESSADKRLDLLHVKAVKAKSQLKTVVSAMGKDNYSRFLSLINLSEEEWQWDVIRARY